MGADLTSNKAAWLIAGFVGRKVMKDMLGRWSLIPILAVGLCMWTKWKSRQQVIKAEQHIIEKTQSTARQQLHELHQSKLRHLPSKQSQSVRGLGARLGIAPASTIYMMNHGNNSTGCNVAKDSTWSSLGDVATAWLGGGSSGGHMCGADRSRSRGGDGGEWGGAFTNRMGGIPRRNAFKTARGKVYIRSGNQRTRQGSGVMGTRTIGGLESVREEDE